MSFEQLESRLAMTVVINEFLAENTDGIRDAATHRHDWIELKNIGAIAQDLAGWYLTDNSGNLTKSQIPNAGALTVLDPGEILLVYASGNNGEVGLVSGELHTNFQLSKEPGFLALVQPDGTTIEHQFNLYPQQIDDVSYGLGVGIGSTTTETLLSGGTASTGDGSPAQFRPFTGPDADVDDHWTDIDYVATGGDGWQIAGVTNGLGFGYGSPWQDSTVSLNGEVAGYVRMPFSVTNKAELVSMNLNLRVDNGYIVFLNGREVQRERLATDYKIGNDWELNARQNLSNATTTGSPAVIDLTPWLDTIEEGDNVLAIYAANHTSDLSDYLVHAELTAKRAAGATANTFMVTPTPGTENGAGYLGVVADTVFSHQRGFYDAPFPLTISTVEPGTTIVYTIDGSRPTFNEATSTITNGTAYSGPITIDPSTLSYSEAGVVTVRAAAFKNGYFSSNVDTQTYIFLDAVLNQDAPIGPSASPWGYAGADWAINPSIVSAVGAANFKDDLKAIPTMSLVMDWEELFGDGSSGDGHGIYTQSESWRDKSDERFASLEYFTDGLTEEFQVDAKVEIQGHSSAVRWRSDKLSFEVKFKQPYDTGLDSATLFGNSVADGANAATSFDSLVLDAQYNYTFAVNNTTTQGPYATFIHDQVVADLSNLAGGEAPHGRWVHLYINGMYWGIYNAHEKPTDSFAESYYGGDKDDYLVVKGFDGIGLTHGGTQDKYLQADGGLASQIAYQALLDQVDDNLTNLAEYQQVQEVLDVDSFINYMVVHYYAANYDWGENNWYASFNSVDPNGQWHFHSWDQEHAFPTNQNGAVPTGSNPNQDYDHTAAVANDFGEHQFGPTGIHHRLMSSEEYRLRFSDRVQELLRNDGLLTPANAQSVWQARVDEISGAINGEAARWGDNRTPAKDGDTWATNVQYTTDHFFFANGSYQSRTDEVIDIFNRTSGSGVGKIDWLANLGAATFNQYGGTITTPFNLTLSNPNGTGTIYYTLDGTDPREPGGGLSASAIAYTGAINLTDSTRVRARVRDTAQSGTANDWSAIEDRLFSVAEDPLLNVRIVELHYHPANHPDVADDEDLEFIELINTGNTVANLEGLQIAEFASPPYVFGAGITLDPGERIVVARDVTQFQLIYGMGINLAPVGYESSGNLSNGGEGIKLQRLVGSETQLIQFFTYDDAGLWPTAADGDGPSLEYIGPLNAGENPDDVSPLDPFDNPANWRASLTAGGSPGSSGDLAPIPGDYDGSRTVDHLDYAMWKSQYGETVAPFTESDGNGDGKVDAADYTVWRNNLGATDPGAGAGGGGLAEIASTTDTATVSASESPAPVTWGPIAVGATQVSTSTSFVLRGTRVAAAVENDALLWHLLDEADSAEVTAVDVIDALVAVDEPASPDAAVLWEDDGWLTALGRRL